MDKINSPATNKDNFAYATQLKQKGYLTAVHALPTEYRNYIDTRLADGISPRKISLELVSRYGKEIEAYGLKQISHMSIRGYRDKYWRKTTPFNRLVLEGSDSSGKAVNEVMNKFNALNEMIKMAQIQEQKTSLFDGIEDKIKMPTNKGEKSRRQLFDMCNAILGEEIALGLRPKASLERNSTITDKTSVETVEDTKEAIRKAKKVVLVLEGKGAYAKRESTGEDLRKTTIK